MKAAAQPWKPSAGRWPPWRRPRRPARRSASLGYPGTGSRPPDSAFRRARPPGPPYPPGPRPTRGSHPSGAVALSGPRRLSTPPDLSAFPNPTTGPAGPTNRLDPLGRRGRRARSDHPSGLLEKVRQIPRPGRAATLRREMEEGVPEVVDVLRATVAAGINPRRALQAAAEGAPAALVAVLDQAIRAAELGAGAGRALATAAEAERLTELALAGEALDLAETTGAPPGPVLAGVATAAADRVRSRRAMLAATAQARLSARVVAAMAPAFLCVLALTAPSEAAFLIREPLGWATLVAATAFESLGIWWAAHIVRGPAP